MTYNHPCWSQENYLDYSAYQGMHALEILNYGTEAAGYQAYAPGVYDDLLKLGNRIFAVAADDNHNKHPDDSGKCDSFGGFVMIKAEKLEYETITDAMFRGDFYASSGPEIQELYIEDEKIHVKCSDAVRVSVSSNRRSMQAVCAVPGQSINEAEFDLRRADQYFRITVTDQYGKHADTRAFFTDELNQE